MANFSFGARFFHHPARKPGWPALLAGLAGLILASAPGAAMDFSTVPLDRGCQGETCPRAVVAKGEIESQTTHAFAQFLQQEMQRPGLHAVVFMHSPGGSVESALRLGHFLHKAGAAVVIGQPVGSGQAGEGAGAAPARAGNRERKRGTFTILPGRCASACVYALMGAKRRIVPTGSRLGVHQMSAKLWGRDPSGETSTGRMFAGAKEIEALRAYVASVGGSQELIDLAESVPHDRIRVLSDAEIRKYRLGVPKL